MIGATGGKNRKYYVRRKSRHFLIGFLACFFSIHAKSNEKVPDETHAVDHFSWNEHRMLSWSDFRGPVSALNEESAAATCCSIGFKLDNDASGRPEVSVYNTFYIGKSWVKDDARIESILAHEQGHFDLCELFTRKLRSRISTVDLSSQNVKQELMNIYSAVSDEYETFQQSYERETTHGTNIPEQRRWQELISKELGGLSIPS